MAKFSTKIVKKQEHRELIGSVSVSYYGLLRSYSKIWGPIMYEPYFFHPILTAYCNLHFNVPGLITNLIVQILWCSEVFEWIKLKRQVKNKKIFPVSQLRVIMLPLLTWPHHKGLYNDIHTILQTAIF